MKLSGLTVETLDRMAANMERCAAQRDRWAHATRINRLMLDHMGAAERYRAIARGCRDEIALLNGGENGSIPHGPRIKGATVVSHVYFGTDIPDAELDRLGSEVQINDDPANWSEIGYVMDHQPLPSKWLLTVIASGVAMVLAAILALLVALYL